MAAAGGAPAGGRVAVWFKAEDLQCPICFGLLSRPATLLCGHSFCLGCIRRWAQGLGRCCPTCTRGSLDQLPGRNVLLEAVLEQYCRAASGGALLEGRPPPPPPPQWASSIQALVRQRNDGGLQDVMKISELPQQIEATLKAVDSLKKDDAEIKECVSQIKISVAEAFAFLKNYINDQEKMVLSVIDKGYKAAQQKRDLIDDQLKARNEELLELQTNSEELIKNTSLEQEVCISNPVEMADVALAAQKCNNIAYVVEEFKRQLEKSVFWSYPVQLPQASLPEKWDSHEIQMEVAEGEIASSSNSTQSQDSSQETSSCSSVMSSISDGDNSILQAVPSTSRGSPDSLRREEISRRSVTEKARSIMSSQFSQWASNITFDLETLNDRLELFEDKKKVSVSHFPTDYEHSARRFRISQVLGCQGFSDGCHYWEVITKDATGWAVGIAHEGIGNRDMLGRTELSWCVEWSNKCLSAWHRDREIPISNKKPLQVGVFLDIPRNHLCFYSITDQETLLHEFEIHVASCVYPAFWIFGLNAGESLTIINIRKC